MMDLKRLNEYVLKSFITDGSVDVVKVAGEIGLRVRPENLDESVIARFTTENDNKVIITNLAQNWERIRFGLAYLTAFCVLHPQTGPVSLNIDTVLDRSVEEVAVNILLPEDAISSFMHDCGINHRQELPYGFLEEMAKKFNVSQALAALRLKELGYNVFTHYVS